MDNVKIVDKPKIKWYNKKVISFKTYFFAILATQIVVSFINYSGEKRAFHKGEIAGIDTCIAITKKLNERDAKEYEKYRDSLIKLNSIKINKTIKTVDSALKFM